MGLCPRTRPFTKILCFGNSFSLVLKGTQISSRTAKVLSSLQQIACLLKHRRGCFQSCFINAAIYWLCLLLTWKLIAILSASNGTLGFIISISLCGWLCLSAPGFYQYNVTLNATSEDWDAWRVLWSSRCADAMPMHTHFVTQCSLHTLECTCILMESPKQNSMVYV